MAELFLVKRQKKLSQSRIFVLCARLVKFKNASVRDVQCFCDVAVIL